MLANQLLGIGPTSHSDLIASLLSSLASRSVFYYLGWYAVLHFLYESERETTAKRTDILFGLLLAAFNLLPGPSITWLSATALGAFLWATTRNEPRRRAAAVVLLALACNGLWGPRIFDFFAIYLLRADAALVGSILAITQPGMTWSETIVGSATGHNLFIYSPCSSFHNISLGLLGWVTITKLFRVDWARADVLVAFAVAATVIVLNGSRLYLMALSLDSFDYWHDGFGELLFAWTTTIAVLVISLWGALRARPGA